MAPDTLKSATGVGMPALSMSGLWALGLGFPRPPCQRISSHSDHRECRTVPPLFSNATAAAHIPLYNFHAWRNFANTWQWSYYIPCSTSFDFSPPFFNLSTPPCLCLLCLFFPSLPPLFFNCVLMSLRTVILFLFFSEEGRRIMLSPNLGRPVLSCL